MKAVSSASLVSNRSMGPTTTTTAAAGVLVLRNDQLLMVRQKRASGMRWEIPSGGQEPGETLEAAAVREAKEETGLAISLTRMVCTYSSFRLHQGCLVLGVAYQAELTDLAAAPIPQTDDGIVEASFVNPFSLPQVELGRLSGLIIERWWPRRHDAIQLFHVELWRSPQGYLIVPTPDEGLGQPHS